MFCRKLMGNRESGDDLFQDALIQAYLNFDKLRDSSAFNAWLYRIIVNAFKSRKRRPLWKKMIPLQGTEDIIHVHPGQEEAYGRKQTLEIALSAISTDQRALVVLHEVEGWPVKDLAQLLNKTEGAIKAGLFRARRKMKSALVKASKASQLSDVPVDRKDTRHAMP